MSPLGASSSIVADSRCPGYADGVDTVDEASRQGC